MIIIPFLFPISSFSFLFHSWRTMSVNILKPIIGKVELLSPSNVKNTLNNFIYYGYFNTMKMLCPFFFVSVLIKGCNSMVTFFNMRIWQNFITIQNHFGKHTNDFIIKNIIECVTTQTKIEAYKNEHSEWERIES